MLVFGESCYEMDLLARRTLVETVAELCPIWSRIVAMYSWIFCSENSFLLSSCF